MKKNLVFKLFFLFFFGLQAVVIFGQNTLVKTTDSLVARADSFKNVKCLPKRMAAIKSLAENVKSTLTSDKTIEKYKKMKLYADTIQFHADTIKQYVDTTKSIKPKDSTLLCGYVSRLKAYATEINKYVDSAEYPPTLFELDKTIQKVTANQKGNVWWYIGLLVSVLLSITLSIISLIRSKQKTTTNITEQDVESLKTDLKSYLDNINNNNIDKLKESFPLKNIINEKILTLSNTITELNREIEVLKKTDKNYPKHQSNIHIDKNTNIVTTPQRNLLKTVYAPIPTVHENEVKDTPVLGQDYYALDLYDDNTAEYSIISIPNIQVKAIKEHESRLSDDYCIKENKIDVYKHKNITTVKKGRMEKEDGKWTIKEKLKIKFVN